MDDRIYQWDINRKIKVDESVQEVHFAIDESHALVTLPIDNIVSIPNVLLQSGNDITVHMVIDNQTTKHAKLRVIKRAKPDDYVYTETEVFTYKALEERIKQLEDNDGSSGGSSSGSGVSDVFINGASIVDKDGNANVPRMSADGFGVAKIWNAFGINIHENGHLMIEKANTNDMNTRDANYKSIVPSNFGYMLKRAMSDGIDAEWTSQEKAMARNRLGIDVWEEVADVIIEEETSDVILQFENAYKELYVYVSQSAVEEIMTGNLYVYPLLQGDATTKSLRQYVGAKVSTTYPDVTLRCINHDDLFVEISNATCNAQKNTTTYQKWTHYHDVVFNEKLSGFETLNFYGLYCAMSKVGTRIRVLGVRA